MTDPLLHALLRWRATRHPRWAQLVAWLTPPATHAVGAGRTKQDHEQWLSVAARGAPEDLPALLAGCTPALKVGVATARVQALAQRDDPRVVDWLLGLFAAPPYREASAKSFYAAVLTTLQRGNDSRVKEGLATAAERFDGVVQTPIGAEVAAAVRRAARALPSATPPPLSAEDEAALAQWEAQLAEQVQRRRRETTDVRDSASHAARLLDAVFEHPEDDGPRQVYADFLTERGDERGLFITLQLARAKGQLDLERLRREAELMQHRGARELAAGVLRDAGTCYFERGFPVAVSVASKFRHVPLDSRAWRTLRDLHGLNALAQPLAAALLDAEVSRRAAAIGFVDVAAVQASRTARFAARALVLVCGPRAGLVDEALCRRFPDLRALLVSNGSLTPAALASLPALESLTGWGDLELTQAALRAAPGLRHLRLNTGTRQRLPTTALAALPALEALELPRGVPADDAAGLRVRGLGVWLDVERPPTTAALAALPTLEVLRVEGPRPFERSLPPLLVALRGAALPRLRCDSYLTVRRPGAEPVLAWRAVETDVPSAEALGPLLAPLGASLELTPLWQLPGPPPTLDVDGLRRAWSDRVTIRPFEPLLSGWLSAPDPLMAPLWADGALR